MSDPNRLLRFGGGASRDVNAGSGGLTDRGFRTLIFNAQHTVNFTPGGYPEEIFLDLKPDDIKKYECCIW